MKLWKSNQFCLSLFCGSLMSLLGLSTAHAQTPINITYTLTANQKVSLNIYNSSGQIVRELLHTAERTVGSKTEQWDGRDDAGNAVPTGSYTWKMLGTPGFGVEYITSPGSNYPTNGKAFNDTAAGCHGGPSTVAVDANGYYVGATSENIDLTVTKQSLDGTTRLWGQGNFQSMLSPSSLALSGTTLWQLYPNGYAYASSTTTGEYINQYITVASGGENPTDMAVKGTDFIFSYPTAGLVRWLDSTGTQTRSVDVVGATTVDVASDGTAYVLSGTNLLKIAVGATSATTLVSSGLTAPRRAAVNPTNGDIYVVDCPQWSGGQIKRYSSAGTLLQTYGTAGGRTFGGLYQNKKTDFAGVVDIAVETDGKFWVAEGERAPRRVARFNQNGAWISETYGGQAWAPWTAFEPDNPNYVWTASSWGDVIRANVNYSTKTWTVDSVYIYQGLAGGLIDNHFNGEDWQTRLHNGTLYLCRAGNWPVIIKVDRTNRQLIPSTMVIGNFWRHDKPQWLYDNSGGNQSVQWVDANGDGTPLNSNGTPQSSELTYYPTDIAYVANSTPDPNFNWITAGGARKFPVASWNAIGAPVYGNLPDGLTLVSPPSRLTGATDDRWSAYAAADADGNLWGAFNPNITGWGASSDAFLARWNPNGTLAWQSGRINGKAGSLGTLRHIYGVINNGTGYNCAVVGRFSYEWPSEGPTPIYVYDQDGLYAGPLLGKPVNQGTTPTWRYGLGGEALSGQILKHTDGTVYFCGQWINDGRVYKSTGWTGWQRSNGTVTVPAGYTAPVFTEEPVGPTGTGVGLQANYYPSNDWTGAPTITRIDPELNFTWNQQGQDTGSPIAGDAFYSVRWTGSITARRTGWHMFTSTVGPFYSLTVNGTLINDAENKGKGRAVWLQSGQAYPIEVTYTSAPPVGVHPSTIHGMVLQWAEPETNGAFAIIPRNQLNPVTPGTGTGLKGEYFNGVAFNTLVTTRTDPTVNFNWGAGSPSTSINTNSFSTRWTGKVMPQYSETYTFTTTTDDGLRLWVNNVQLINKWVNQGATAWTGTIALEAGKHYDIKMEYYDNTGNASAKLEWQSASQAKQVVPQTALFPAL